MSIYKVSGLALAAMLAASPSTVLAETDTDADLSTGSAQAAQPAGSENTAGASTAKATGSSTTDSEESIGAGPEGTAGTAGTESWVAEGDISGEEAEGFYPEPPSEDTTQAGTLGLTDGTGEIDTSDLTGSPTGLGAANTDD